MKATISEAMTHGQNWLNPDSPSVRYGLLLSTVQVNVSKGQAYILKYCRKWWYRKTVLIQVRCKISVKAQGGSKSISQRDFSPPQQYKREPITTGERNDSPCPMSGQECSRKCLAEVQEYILDISHSRDSTEVYDLITIERRYAPPKINSVTRTRP